MPDIFNMTEQSLEHMWNRDADNPFSFNKVRQYFEPYEILTIIEAFKNEEDLSAEIKFFHDEDEEVSGFIFPAGEAVSLWLQDEDRLDFNDRDTLELITYPVYSEDDQVEWVDANETLWSVRWEENYDRLDTVALGGRTDFYDKYGWWPFAVSKNKEASLPLMYYAELKIDGRKAYMFSDFNYMDDAVNDINDVSLFPHGTGVRDVIIFEDTLTLPANFKKETLTSEQQALYTPAEFDADNGEKRIIPYDPPFRFIAGINDGSIPDPPFNHFLFQLPVPWHGFREASGGLFTVHDGDYGSTRVFWDRNDNFYFDYQQT